MKLVNHWKVGEIVLTRLGQNKINEYNIDKTAYLIGNILPDLNCVYPAHRLSTTCDRFNKHLKYIDNSDNKFMRSLYLGVVTHYLCDYFCYAHISESLGLLHKQYEKNLYNFFLKHRKDVDYSDLYGLWNSVERDISDLMIDDIRVNIDKHCIYIISQLKYMSEQYKANMISRDYRLWTSDMYQIQLDMKYIMFMINNMLDMIMEPCMCMETYV